MTIVTDYTEIPLNTPIDDIPSKVQSVVEGFKTNKTRDVSFRKGQLRNLFYAIYDNVDLLHETLELDLHKPAHESDVSEISFVLKEIMWFIENLSSLAKPEKASIDLIQQPASAKVQRVPFGTVLVISPWNYPVMLSISPVAAALAAGNTVVLKVSELVPHTSRAIVMLLQAYLDPQVFVGITGSVPQATMLLAQKFDKILYTGNESVGRIVSKAAAKYLTPVILELGGKSPVIVTRYADLRLAARRVLWGKYMNAGQTCVAPDYILVEEYAREAFIMELKNAYKEFAGELEATTPGYAHIVNEHHFERLDKLLKDTKGKVVVGGAVDPSNKFIAPTFVDGVDSTDSLLQDEIFGPLIGIISVPSLSAALEFIEREHPTPLALYLFSNNAAEQALVLGTTRSGAVGINDPLMHVALLHTPFGGVGTSGSGSYHGLDGFLAFSHRRTVFSQSSVIEPLMAMRYPPYTASKSAQFRMVGGMPKPWFGRKGPVLMSPSKQIMQPKILLTLIVLSLIMAFYL